MMTVQNEGPRVDRMGRDEWGGHERDGRDARPGQPVGGMNGWSAEHPGTIDGHSAMFAALGGALIVAGGLVAAINSAAPFAHGSWLAAYLVLVGGVSQLLLGLGRLLLPTPGPSVGLRRAEMTLWNTGNLAVAGGVLIGAAAMVTLGSVALLVAMACFAVGAGPGRHGGRGRVIAYHAVIVALAASVIVGSVLADAALGGWT